MSGRWDQNRRHWEETLDAHNLGRRRTRMDLERQVALYATADIRYALSRMEPLAEAPVLDVGGGLALAAILLARRGARVTIADLSLPRLRAAREALESLGLAGRVDLVVARAEELPFAAGAFRRILTKAVLIHTDLPRAMGQLHHALSPGGRIFIIEPTRFNPFVNLYRRLLAPKVWAHITSYFGAEERRVVHESLPPGCVERVRPFYLFGFFATVFEFAIPSPALYRLSETLLCGVDTLLFAVVPPLARLSWFQVIEIGPDRASP